MEIRGCARAVCKILRHLSLQKWRAARSLAPQRLLNHFEFVVNDKPSAREYRIPLAVVPLNLHDCEEVRHGVTNLMINKDYWPLSTVTLGPTRQLPAEDYLNLCSRN